MKRLFDIVLSAVGLLLLLPVFFMISLYVLFDSGFPVLYVQERIGRFGIPFGLLKFRTMRPDSDSKGLLTVGHRDARITRAGYYLRKYKLDELPQLLNVLTGDMSLVGPRPEVRKYVELYSEEQKKVLSVRPGITDYASIVYANENELLSRSDDPERQYVERVMPAKLKLNLRYIEDQSPSLDISIILRTIGKILD